MVSLAVRVERPQVMHRAQAGGNTQGPRGPADGKVTVAAAAAMAAQAEAVKDGKVVATVAMVTDVAAATARRKDQV